MLLWLKVNYFATMRTKVKKQGGNQMKIYIITTKDSYGCTENTIVSARSEGEALKRVEISDDTKFLQISEVV